MSFVFVFVFVRRASASRKGSRRSRGTFSRLNFLDGDRKKCTEQTQATNGTKSILLSIFKKIRKGEQIWGISDGNPNTGKISCRKLAKIPGGTVDVTVEFGWCD
jgi:hypothetical protein